MSLLIIGFNHFIYYWWVNFKTLQVLLCFPVYLPFFWDRVSLCSPCWQLVILLSQPPKCWDYGVYQACLTFTIFYMLYFLNYCFTGRGVNVTFTKILTIYHSWIHLLHYSPLFPLTPIPGKFAILDVPSILQNLFPPVLLPFNLKKLKLWVWRP
jgi:hypothetical protein